MFKTTLQRLDLLEDTAWADQIGIGLFNVLTLADNTETEVEVVACVAPDPDGIAARGYYDIRICEQLIPAISGFHLRHIEDFAAHGKPITLGLQFALELKVEGYVPDSPLDHEQMQRALSLFVERALVNFGYAGHRTTLSSLVYEADYPLDN